MQPVTKSRRVVTRIRAMDPPPPPSVRFHCHVYYYSTRGSRSSGTMRFQGRATSTLTDLRILRRSTDLRATPNGIFPRIHDPPRFAKGSSRVDPEWRSTVLSRDRHLELGLLSSTCSVYFTRPQIRRPAALGFLGKERNTSPSLRMSETHTQSRNHGINRGAIALNQPTRFRREQLLRGFIDRASANPPAARKSRGESLRILGHRKFRDARLVPCFTASAITSAYYLRGTLRGISRF